MLEHVAAKWPINIQSTLSKPNQKTANLDSNKMDTSRQTSVKLATVRFVAVICFDTFGIDLPTHVFSADGMTHDVRLLFVFKFDFSARWNLSLRV